MSLLFKKVEFFLLWCLVLWDIHASRSLSIYKEGDYRGYGRHTRWVLVSLSQAKIHAINGSNGVMHRKSLRASVFGMRLPFINLQTWALTWDQPREVRKMNICSKSVQYCAVFERGANISYPARPHEMRTVYARNTRFGGNYLKTRGTKFRYF